MEKVKPLAPENLVQVLRSWRELCGHQKDLERTLLKLARHPEATPEQLESALVIYRKAYAEIRKMEPTMKNIGIQNNRRQLVATVTLTDKGE
jgi:hypothetical protein